MRISRILFITLGLLCAAAARVFPSEPFVVYTSQNGRNNHFVPSGWAGDTGDIRINAGYTGNCRSPEGCVQFIYSSKKSQGAGWAAVYWQNPANNWGSQKAGYDLDGKRRLTFWARGENGGERIDKFQVGGITGQYPDSTLVSIGPFTLTKEWTQYSVYLEGRSLFHVISGFSWVATADVNQESRTFYIDKIQFEQ